MKIGVSSYSYQKLFRKGEMTLEDAIRFTAEVIAREMKLLGGGDKAEHTPAPPEDSNEPPITDDVPF